MLLRSIRSRLLVLVLATVIPFMALMGAGLWSQWRSDHAAALQRALNEARLLAAQVDDHIGNLDNLLLGRGRAVSTNPSDTSANDALLRQVKSELPGFITNIALFTLEGANIGTSWEGTGARANIADRLYFRQAMAEHRLTVGEVHIGRTTGQWAVNVARPVFDRSGELRAVLAIGTRLERFQDVLRLDDLPPGGVVRIVNELGI